MRLFAAATMAGACLATAPLHAADLFGSAPPPMSEPAAQTELGSNWYIRGDVGYGPSTQSVVDPTNSGLIPAPKPATNLNPYTNQVFSAGFNVYDQPSGDASGNVPIQRGLPQKINNMSYDVGLGYRVNDYLRLEATYGFHFGPGLSTQKTVICPGQVTGVDNYFSTITAGVTTYTQTPVGYIYPNTTCNGYLNATQYNNTVLASANIDLGKWWVFEPYIGVGGGVNASTISGSVHYNNTSDGSAYSGVKATGDTSAPAYWVAPLGLDSAGHMQYGYLNGPHVELGSQNWNRTFNSTKFTFAGQLAAGVAVPISQSAMLDLSYRFTTYDIGHVQQNYMQSVNLGVRYNIN